MVAIMYPLTPVDGISFTRNHASIVSAINKFEGRKFRYEPRNQFEEQYARYPTEQVEYIRNDVVMTALRGASTRLGSLREGRKALIFVSEGLTAMLPPQMRNMDASMPGVFTNPVARNPTAGENNPREDTARFFAQSDLYSRMRDVFTAANRNNTAIYSLDPRGLATGEFQIDEPVGPNQDRAALQFTQDTLRTLSSETDGRAIVNRNDLAGGLSQVVRDSSAYYLIGYTSATPAGRQVSRHQGACEASRHRGAGAQGVTGRPRSTTPCVPRRRRRKRRRRSRTRSRRSRRRCSRESTCARGSAPSVPTTARRA